jgi:hypothetical protein
MKSQLEPEFHEEMVLIFHKSEKATGYWPRRILQKVRKVGGLQAAREWLGPGKDLSPGLQRLAKEKRIDLSMEALVLKEPWSQLFTEDEIKQARRRLAAASKMVEP